MRTVALLSLLALAQAVASQAQLPLSTGKRKPLTGRFLHLTDFHPDPHYIAGGTFDSGCHSKAKGKGKGKGKGNDDVAGKWGSPVSDCDSPMSLVDLTFEWLKKEWAEEVDFVVWTGDNARHDIDRSTPRTPKEIFELNRMMVDKMVDTFGKEVVIVPSIGNNDIYPHNVLAPGPNHITSEFLQIWKHYIPTDERHVFERGAYFSAEVVPDRLAVISLNTLYWYDSNTLVDGCGDRSNDPGALEMDWLEVQLQEFRDRGMQVWLSGHVPPHMGHYYDNCYLRYGDLSLRFQDTIVGHLYGHMNIDHFFFIDVQELESTLSVAPFTNTSSTESFESSFAGPELRHGPHLPSSSRYRIKGRSGSVSLQEELKKDFKEMPSAGKLKMKDYIAVNVAPSIIPTYLPGVRVFSYNISGVSRDPDDDDVEIGVRKKKGRHGGHRHHLPKDDCSRPENEDKPHCTFKHKPRYYSKHSPSRSNQPLTPLGYTQFYLPDLDAKHPQWAIEYSTFKPDDLFNLTTQPPPVPSHFLHEKEDKKLKTLMKKITPYRMKDLTVGSYVRLARKLAEKKEMWDKFSELM
ncbi:endopolyphosphatase, partial [Tremellales sp. Uapishka_1]